MSEVEFYQAKVDECRRMLSHSEDPLAFQVYEAMLRECQDRLSKAARADLRLKMLATRPLATPRHAAPRTAVVGTL
jgi:hypothetical protein